MGEDLHNKVYAFHVKCPFKSGAPADHCRGTALEKRTRRSAKCVDSCIFTSRRLNRMVSSYPLPEGFSEFDVFSMGSLLLVEGE